MNNLLLSFRAQSQDNQAADPVEINEQSLTEEDLSKRISKVSLKGTKVFSEGVHTAFLHDEEFILQTPSDQSDEAGRMSPILCYGHVPDAPQESWPRDVIKAVVGFAGSIGRTISGENQKKAHHGVEAILKKKQRNRRHREILLWSAVMAVLSVVVIVLWIIFKK